MIRRTVPLFLLLLALMGGALAALPGSAQATAVTTPAPGTVLSAQRVIRPGTLHNQRAYQAHFQVQGYPGVATPGRFYVWNSRGQKLALVPVASPCSSPTTACSDVWDIWVPVVAINGLPLPPGSDTVDLRLPDGGPDGMQEIDLGTVTVERKSTVRVLTRVRAARARVWSGRFVGRCSRMHAPGRLLGRGSVGLYSQARCTRHRHRAGRVQQLFSVATTPLAGSERVTYPDIGLRLAKASTRGKVKAWIRATGSSVAWTPCRVDPGRRSSVTTCVVPWSPDLGDRAFGAAQVLVRAQHGARVDVGRILADVGYYVWTAP